MPIYEYICSDCGRRFEVTHLTRESYENLNCPACESVSVGRALSTFSVSVSSNVAAPPRCEMTGSCPTPNIPGCRTGTCGI